MKIHMKKQIRDFETLLRRERGDSAGGFLKRSGALQGLCFLAMAFLLAFSTLSFPSFAKTGESGAGTASEGGSGAAEANAAQARQTQLILIGDSRTEGMAQYIGNVQGRFLNHWIYKTSSGYQYMVGTAFPYADSLIAQAQAADPAADIRLICMFGMNDCYNVQKYAASLNQKAAALKSLGVKTYFVSVNPIADEMSSYKYDKNEYAETFNATIRPLLSEDVIYIDTYSQILGEFRNWCSDGVHYRREGCQRIYSIITDMVLAT